MASRSLMFPVNFPLGHKPTWRTGVAEVELQLDAEGKPEGLALRLQPLPVELLAHLPQLAPQLPVSADQAARAAAQGGVSLGFEAPPELLAQLPQDGGMELADWVARFEAHPAWKQPEAYRLVSLSQSA